MPGLEFDRTPVNNEDFFSSTLNNAFALRRQEVEQGFSDKLATLEFPVDKQIGQLKDKYRLREYQLRRAKLTDEDFGKQMNRLIEKYEQEELKIKQRASTTLDAAKQQLEGERVNTLAQLEAEQHKTMGKIQAINYLAETGKLPPEEAQQELYKMVGIEYKPKTIQEQFQQTDSYIKDLEMELRHYIPPKSGFWTIDKPLRYDETAQGYEDMQRNATPREKEEYNILLQELKAARRQRNLLKQKIHGKHLRIGALQSAYTQKANKSFTRGKKHMRNFDVDKNAFVDKFIETGKSPTVLTTKVLQEKPQKKQLNATTAKLFLQQANGDKEKARQLARQAGYEF